jgi:four helix bundle protein
MVVGGRLWAVDADPTVRQGIGMRDHSKLKAYQMADALVLEVYKATRGFPQEERFGLASQMRRAALSTVSNLVEGSARTSEPEYARFVEIALGSSRELQYQISLAARLGYLEVDALEPAATLVAKTLGALLKALRSPRS